MPVPPAGDSTFDCRDCTNPSAIGCDNFQWSQPSNCSFGAFQFSETAFNHGCDGSPGHSGGPIFYNDGGYYVIGEQSTQMCDTCVGHPFSANPNLARRIDNNLYMLISLFKAWNP